MRRSLDALCSSSDEDDEEDEEVDDDDDEEEGDEVAAPASSEDEVAAPVAAATSATTKEEKEAEDEDEDEDEDADESKDKVRIERTGQPAVAPPTPSTDDGHRPPSLVSRQNSSNFTTSLLRGDSISREKKNHEWTTAAWVASLPGVTRAIAAALHGAQVDPQSELEHIRQLGRRRVSAAEVRAMLESGGLLETLSEELSQAADTFSKQRAATAGELHEKFCLDNELNRMKFGELKNFYKGLEGVVGPPATDLETGMLREHTKSRDSQQVSAPGRSPGSNLRITAHRV